MKSICELEAAGRKVEQGGKVYLVVRGTEIPAVIREVRAAGYRMMVDLSSGRYAGTQLVKTVHQVADAHGEMIAEVFVK